MTATDDSEEQERAYLVAIEEELIRRRGAPLLLSPAEWRLGRRWFADGVPLDLVLDTMGSLFEREETHRRPRTLRYCRPAIEAAWQAQQELIGPSERRGESLDLPARLRALIDRVPGDLPGREDWCDRILATTGELEVAEASLRELEQELLDHLSTSLPDAERSELESHVESTAQRVRGALDPDGRAELRSRLWAEAVRRRFRLPPLSVFSVDRS